MELKCLVFLYGEDWGSYKSGGSDIGFLLFEGPPTLYLLVMLALCSSLSDMCVRAEEKEFVVLTGTSVPSGGVVVYLYCGMGTSNPRLY